MSGIVLIKLRFVNYFVEMGLGAAGQPEISNVNNGVAVSAPRNKIPLNDICILRKKHLLRTIYLASFTRQCILQNL